MRHSLLSSTALIAALACAPLAFAAAPPASAPAGSTGAAAQQHWNHHDRGHMRRGHMGKRGMDMLHKLDLTDAQRTQIKAIRKEGWTQSRTSMQTLRQQRMAYEHATPGTSAYQTAVDSLAQAASSAAHARIVNAADQRTKIYNVLTPEQRTKLASMRSERKARMQKWHTEHMQHAAKSSAPAASTP